MTQLEAAREGELTPVLCGIAEAESLAPETLRSRVARGTVVIPANTNHTNLEPIGIGEGLRIKVNANLGTSSVENDLEGARDRLRVALEAKADTVMDLSSAGDLDAVRRVLLADSPVPFGTVPIYQAAVEAVNRHGDLRAMSADDLFEVIEKHAQDGVDFITVHCGLTRSSLAEVRGGDRLTGVVSRGGTFTACWMLAHDAENPLFEQYDRLLEIARAYDVTLSLGDALRPGCLADGTDRAQVAETVVLGDLVRRARAAGVQSMVEGPGHLPLDQVVANVVLEKQVCDGAPFYVLGPLVTDVAPGYDHLTSAIGGALAGMAGADFLCYVTPAEHLSLPTEEDVREGVIATRIAAHAADIVRLGERAMAWDIEMAKARQALDWPRQFELAIDPARARARYHPGGPGACSMCGQYCVFGLLDEKARPAGR